MILVGWMHLNTCDSSLEIRPNNILVLLPGHILQRMVRADLAFCGISHLQR